jgi:hypothetical protein
MNDPAKPKNIVYGILKIPVLAREEATRIAVSPSKNVPISRAMYPYLSRKASIV